MVQVFNSSPALASLEIRQNSVIGSNKQQLLWWRLPNDLKLAVTEEFNRSASVITAGAWASGGAI